jgi:hypothetical protein
MEILRWFECDHLKSDLKNVAEPIQCLALRLDQHLPDGREKAAGLRKLLEAKDCFVRAKIQENEDALIEDICGSIDKAVSDLNDPDIQKDIKKIF